MIEFLKNLKENANPIPQVEGINDLHIPTPMGFLMNNWHDMRKDDLAHIAIEAIGAAEYMLKKTGFFVPGVYEKDFREFYSIIRDELIEYGYWEEDENDQ